MSDHWHQPLMYGAPPPPGARPRPTWHDKIAQRFEERGPHRGRRIQEAIAMVASLPKRELEGIADLLEADAKVHDGADGCRVYPEMADSSRAVAALLRVIHKEQP